jgi:pimeloyl-ACP methyl ester carboxylesterase
MTQRFQRDLVLMDSFLSIFKNQIFVRKNRLHQGRKTLFFIHGLGESGLCFKEVFEYDKFDAFNIVIPDMTGYGKSSSSNSKDYSFKAQMRTLWEIMRRLGLSNITLIGHSLGGVMGTLTCSGDRNALIEKFVNIEGNLTQHELFISGQAVQAEERGEFHSWFSEIFLNSLVYKEWGRKHDSCKRYFASLNFCDKDAFLENARELCNLSRTVHGQYQNEIGNLYCSLSIPKMYCYGTESANPHTIQFLKENNLDYLVFENAFHWLMIDQKEEFYDFLYHFVEKL